MEVAWCRGEVLEVSMQVAQCRAQGSVTLFLSLFLSLSNVITFFPLLILVHVAQP